ncbi:MAG: phage holin family protein, partial [Solirubrobacteraceae bacterium]
MRGIALPIVRIALVWLVATATLLLLSAIFPDIQVEDFGTALLAAALIGLVNAFVWPLLIRIALPFTVLTLGLGVVVLNGAMVLLVSAIEPGLEVSTLLAGIAVALGLTIATTAATSLLAIDDDEFWYRNVIQRQVRRTAKPE